MLARVILPAVAILLAQIVPGQPAAAAPQETSSQNISRVGLGTVLVLREEEVVDIPVYLSLAESVQVSQVEFDLGFARKGFSWVHAEEGIQADLKVVADVRPDSGDSSQTIVHLAIRSESPSGIVNGLIASLRLALMPEVEMGENPISLTQVSAIDRKPPGDPVTDIAGFGASVKVFTPEEYPFVGCFLFAH